MEAKELAPARLLTTGQPVKAERSEYEAQWILRESAIRVYRDCGCYETFELPSRHYLGNSCLTQCGRDCEEWSWARSVELAKTLLREAEEARIERAKQSTTAR